MSAKHFGSTKEIATHLIPMDESITFFPKPNVHRGKGREMEDKKF